jgi:hypothetical protein
LQRWNDSSASSTGETSEPRYHTRPNEKRGPSFR